MKKIIIALLLLAAIVPSTFAQQNILIIDYNNSFSSDQQNNNSRIYNRLLATQTSVTRVAAIPAMINNATYDQVWIFGNTGNPVPATLNPVVNYINGGGAVYFQSEVSCCNNQAAFLDALIDAVVTIGGSITHTTTSGGYYQTGPTGNPCTPNPPTWVTHGAALRPFQGTPPINRLLEANAVCGGLITTGVTVGVKFRACDMISNQGALMAIGDFNVFPTAGACATVGILGTPNDLVLIDYLAALAPTLLNCAPPIPLSMTGPNDTTVCPGANIPASSFTSNPAGATYAWTNSNTAIGLAANGTGNLPAFVATNTTGLPISSMIIVTPSLNGCPGTPDTINITVNPLPVVDAGLDTTLCVGDPVVIGGNPTATGGAPFMFGWTPPGGLNNTTIANPTATPAAAGPTTYVVQVTDSGGCIAYDSVVVTGQSCCVVTIDDTTMTNVSCFGNCDGSINVTATAATQYSIDSGATWQASNVFNNLCASVYQILASDGNCSDSVNVTITEPNPLSIPNVVTDASCNGGSDGQITVNPAGGTPGYSYAWTAGSGGNSPTTTGLSAGQVTVTVTDTNGCMQDSTFTVGEPAPTPLGSFDANVLAGCSPLTVTFTNTMNPNLYTSFSWNFGNGATSTISPDSTTYTSVGTYDVTLNIVDTNGCIGLLVKPAYIEVYPDPIANFTFDPSKPTLFDPTVYFSDLSQTNIVSWDWNFNNLGNSNEQNPIFTFPQDTGTYLVGLKVEDNHGCVDTTVRSVRIFGEYGVYVPTAFSPDEDGLNDGFFPNGFGMSKVNYTFLIFDRWGELLFESHKLFEPWYGDYQGKLVPNGAYVWKLHFEDLDGNEHDRVGHVTILK